MGLVERVWYGEGVAAATARAALWPFARLYDAVITARGALYDANVLPSQRAVLPTLSVGNLTVGGTGKTPLAAWLAERLSDKARPAVALRGYGGDEAEVHRRLNPRVAVVVNADRATAVREARSRGADVVVLDDAFQHRRLKRDADVVLVSAEQTQRARRLLPLGPWREPLTAARRADLVVITRKSASASDARLVANLVREIAPGVPIATVHLAPRSLIDAADATARSIETLRGAAVLVVAAIGEPGALKAQLEQLGARVTLQAHRDHHAYSDSDVREAAALVPADGLAVCTLKDAVKLAGRWPGPSRLWYVSQQLVVEQGAEEIDRLLQRVLAKRASATITAG